MILFNPKSHFSEPLNTYFIERSTLETDKLMEAQIDTAFVEKYDMASCVVNVLAK